MGLIFSMVFYVKSIIIIKNQNFYLYLKIIKNNIIYIFWNKRLIIFL